MDKIMQEKLLALVKRNYEEIAEDFSETRNKTLWPELFKLAADVKYGENVLDVGCGNGRLLKAFEQKQISYTGIDNNVGLIKKAIKNYELKITNYEFKVGNIIELEKIEKKKFDWVFCIAVLHHLPGVSLRLQALRQLKDRLKPDGKIVLTVWNLWAQKKFRKLIWKNILLKLIGLNKMDPGDILFPWKNNRGEPMSERYYHAFNMNELKKLAKQAGLKIEKIYKDKYNYYLVLCL